MQVSFLSYNQQPSKNTSFKGNKFKPIADNFSTLDKFADSASPKVQHYILALKEFINNTGKYKNTHFKDIIGQGGYSIIFDIGNNEVLKFTQENPYQYRKYIEGLDIPLLDFDEHKGFYILKEAKAETDIKKINPEHREEILNIMQQHRLEPSADFNEFRLEQIGLINNKPYLLDSRCAVPKPNRFTEFVENFSEAHRKRKMTFCPKDLNDFSIQHVDETPRANLTLSQGLKKISSTILDNIEYYSLAILNKKSDNFINFQH